MTLTIALVAGAAFIVAAMALLLYTLTRRLARDNTETAQQLRKLSLAVEQNPSSIIVTDAAGRTEYVNRAFTEATGTEPSKDSDVIRFLETYPIQLRIVQTKDDENMVVSLRPVRES